MSREINRDDVEHRLDRLEAARRETAEASDIDLRVTGVWYVRKKTIVHAGNPDRRLHVPEAWFEAGPTDPGVEPDPARSAAGEPIVEAGWFETPPDAVDERFAERVAAWADG